MNVFIDTNALLDFYRLSSGDLQEIRKLGQMVRDGHLNLLLNDHGVDEFSRNREKVIADALSQFEKSKFDLHRPNIVRVYRESNELAELKKTADQLFKDVKGKVMEEAKEHSLKADRVIQELFEIVSVSEVSDGHLRNAVSRVEAGRPPGKKGAIGDAIHWEWLLDTAPSEDLHLVSRDGDFASPLFEEALADYLQAEWSGAKNAECFLYHSIADFLARHLPNIELADQRRTSELVGAFVDSGSFHTTHKAIRQLVRIDDFSREEIESLLEAFRTNDQIRWILGDEDVKEFAVKVVEHAYMHGLESEVHFLEQDLNDLELDENQ